MSDLAIESLEVGSGPVLMEFIHRISNGADPCHSILHSVVCAGLSHGSSSKTQYVLSVETFYSQNNENAEQQLAVCVRPASRGAGLMLRCTTLPIQFSRWRSLGSTGVPAKLRDTCWRRRTRPPRFWYLNKKDLFILNVS